MAQRGGNTKNHIKEQEDIDPIYLRRGFERDHVAIARLFEEKEISSDKEANALIQQFMGPEQEIPRVERELTILEQAQEIMYDAWLERDGKKRIALARKALTLTQDCADAYVLLAEQTATDPAEARRLYEKGVEAGERGLGQESFIEFEGDFWAIVQTRPYMRARFGLAQTLWELGERRDAIVHYRELLRLNPGDNQGVRYELLNALLTEGIDNESEKLLEEYEDEGTAAWAYARALLAFKEFGAGSKANRKLREALKTNPFVPIYLFGLEKPPKKLPGYMGMGDESEALHYLVGNGEVWTETPGAVEWFADIFHSEISSKEKKKTRTRRKLTSKTLSKSQR